MISPKDNSVLGKCIFCDENIWKDDFGTYETRIQAKYAGLTKDGYIERKSGKQIVMHNTCGLPIDEQGKVCVFCNKPVTRNNMNLMTQHVASNHEAAPVLVGKKVINTDKVIVAHIVCGD